MNNTPVEARLATVIEHAAGARARRPAGLNAWAALALELEPESAVQFHREWMAHPLTQLFVGALQTAAILMPPGLAGEDAAAQYGVTQGLALAATLLRDPAAVLPKCFTVRPDPAIEGKMVSDKGTPSDQEVDGYTTKPM